MSYVVVTGQKARGMIGRVVGSDPHESARALVHFPRRPWPRDVVSIRADRLRPAKLHEVMLEDAR